MPDSLVRTSKFFRQVETDEKQLQEGMAPYACMYLEAKSHRILESFDPSCAAVVTVDHQRINELQDRVRSTTHAYC